MVVVIQMLEKSFSNRMDDRNYLQLKIVRQLRTAASDIYSATDDDISSHYSFKYHRGIFLYMYEGVMQSLLMERFSMVMKKRI